MVQKHNLRKHMMSMQDKFVRPEQRDWAFSASQQTLHQSPTQQIQAHGKFNALSLDVVFVGG
jgi:hypothetical protein